MNFIKEWLKCHSSYENINTFVQAFQSTDTCKPPSSSIFNETHTKYWMLALKFNHSSLWLGRFFPTKCFWVRSALWNSCVDTGDGLLAVWFAAVTTESQETWIVAFFSAGDRRQDAVHCLQTPVHSEWHSGNVSNSCGNCLHFAIFLWNGLV